MLCDGAGNPLHFELTPGQTHEAAVFDTVMAGADEQLRDAQNKPMAWPVAMAGDKGYRADWIDEYLLELGITPVIPSKENQDRASRPVKFNKKKYRKRNIVERLIGWLKECRRVFSRYEKTAKNFAGMAQQAMDDTKGNGSRRSAIHKGCFVSPADQRGLSRQGALSRGNPSRRARRDRERGALAPCARCLAAQRPLRWYRVDEKTVDGKELARSLSLFDPLWDSLSPGEQGRVLHLLLERVTYDGGAGTLAITFRPNGIKALTEHLENATC